MKANEERVEYVKRMVGFNEKVVIEIKGRVWGLCLMWKNNMQIEVVEFNMIAVKIIDLGGGWDLLFCLAFTDHLMQPRRERLGRTFMLYWSHFKSLGFASEISTLSWIVKKRMGEELRAQCPQIF